MGGRVLSWGGEYSLEERVHLLSWGEDYPLAHLKIFKSTPKYFV